MWPRGGAQRAPLCPSVVQARFEEGSELSTESIVGAPGPSGAAAQCPNCAAPIAADQRYCLECGERRVPMSGFLMGSGQGASVAPAVSPPLAPALPQAEEPRGSSPLHIIAAVGVLMLAMGVGVLIGRSGNSKPSAAPPQVITVGSVGGATSTGTGTSESFTSDWPTGASGYSVQLQTLPLSGTSVAAVQAAKSRQRQGRQRRGCAEVR